MHEWIDVPDLKPGDIVVVQYCEWARVLHVRPLSTGDYEVLFKKRNHDLFVATFLPATSLQKVRDE